MIRIASRLVRPLLRRYNLDIVRTVLNEEGFPADFGKEEMEIYNFVKPYSLTSMERIFALIQAVRYVVENAIPGAFVECGVWKGGSVMAMAKTLLSLSCTDREIYLFDTLEGMSIPTSEDVDFVGQTAY